jgi:type II secretory pathway pseudopilin PulG
MKFNASTIIETIVALIIIIIIMSVSVTIISNIQKQSILKKSEAFFLIKEEFNKVKREKLFFPEEKKEKNYFIRRNIESTNFGEKLKLLHIEILDEKNQVILQRNEIIVIE